MQMIVAQGLSTSLFVFYDLPTSAAREKWGKVRGAWRDIAGCCFQYVLGMFSAVIHPGKQNQVLLFILHFLCKTYLVR